MTTRTRRGPTTPTRPPSTRTQRAPRARRTPLHDAAVARQSEVIPMTPLSALPRQVHQVVIALALVAGWLPFSGSSGESLAGAAALPATCGAGSSTLAATMPPAPG